ncbi:hypothetical protein DICPUDRAFT_99895 [Dictyostelium purpureum]|uniref:non-specific serine/threonine protein kinase n=1 Tax=Dictyostelium purpureum TaxID=5786 RepID=F1A3K0_DICPU|nr:uncharacterized protein DICPUDRAFT_99895 [Dictyostelium purpureum]EGC29222.1 hypothetical protein DICPUDRAFT_99895 [Dictyostelium purpureum]|eukprot:XP_003294244.1 hypothetical protein DICPUDRAFT_99895 [Dictyostelium purpureum]
MDSNTSNICFDPETDGLPDGSNAFRINIEDLEFGPEIGKGAYGKIFKGEYFGTPVGIKEISLSPNDVKYKDLIKFIQREVAMLRFSHPNLVQFIGVSEKGSNLYIVTEFVSGGDLAYYLFRNKNDDTPEQFMHRKVNIGSSSTPDLDTTSEKLVPLTWPLRIKIAYDVACAMAYLHSRHVIHRDLKSTNLLVGDSWKIKVCDFGFARTAYAGRAKRTMTICGTTNCMAPEVILGQDYNEACDVFSYGIVLSEIITRLETTNNLRPSSLKYGLDVDILLPLVPKDCPPPFLKLVFDCTEYDPDQRPTFKEITERLKSLTKRLSIPNVLPPLRILAQSPITSPLQSPCSKLLYNNVFKSISLNNGSTSSNNSSSSSGSFHQNNNNNNIEIQVNCNSFNNNNNDIQNNDNIELNEILINIPNSPNSNLNLNINGGREEIMSPISMGDESDLDSDDDLLTEDDSYSSASSSRCSSRNGGKSFTNGSGGSAKKHGMGYIIRHHYGDVGLELSGGSSHGGSGISLNVEGVSSSSPITIQSTSPNLLVGIGLSTTPSSSKSPPSSSLSPPSSVKSSNYSKSISPINGIGGSSGSNSRHSSPKSNRFSNGSLKEKFQQYQQQQFNLKSIGANCNDENDKELEELSKSIDDSLRLQFSPLNISPSGKHYFKQIQHNNNNHLISPTIISTSASSSSTSTPSLVSQLLRVDNSTSTSATSSPATKPLSSIASNSSVFTPLSGLTRTVQS